MLEPATAQILLDLAYDELRQPTAVFGALQERRSVLLHKLVEDRRLGSMAAIPGGAMRVVERGCRQPHATRAWRPSCQARATWTFRWIPRTSRTQTGLNEAGGAWRRHGGFGLCQARR